MSGVDDLRGAGMPWGSGKRKFAARAGPSIARSGLHTVNKFLTVLLLRAQMCRASVGRRFAKTRPRAVLLQQNADCDVIRNAITSCNSRKRPVREVTSCVGAWSNYYF